MVKGCGSALLACLLFAPAARADEGEPVALDQLPPAVTDHLKSFIEGAELLQVWKEVEGDRACYVVRIRDGDRVLDYYASSDGHAICLKEDVYSLRHTPVVILAGVLFLVVPGAIVGAVTRGLAGAARDRPLPVPAEWLSAWVGAAMVTGLILMNLSTVPREKDLLVIGLDCLVWGAAAASLVEVIGLTIQSIRGCRVGCRKWALRCCVVGLVSLSLAISVEMLRKERTNQHYRALVMRRPIE